MKKTDRGFNWGDEIPSQYGGYIRAYESSAAFNPSIWVRIECPVNLNEPWGEMKEAVVHIPLAEARRLRDNLTYLIENHFDAESEGVYDYESLYE